MVDSFFVSILLKGVVDGFVWLCMGVYGPTNASLRDTLWAKLDSVRVRWSSAWCVFGDFNIIRYLLSDLGVLHLAQPCSNSQISLRGIFWLIYLWWGMSIRGFENL